MAHSRETAEQVRSEYVDTMGKMYYSYFKDYHSKLMKMQVCTYMYVHVRVSVCHMTTPLCHMTTIPSHNMYYSSRMLPRRTI